MMETIHTLIYFVIAIALLVAIHEYGHFIVARKLGIKVEKFSIGFGPTLFSWRGRDGEVEYIIAAIPLGGYVKMLGESSAEADGDKYVPLSEADLARAFHTQAVWKRASVAVAGPLFNFIFAIFAYMFIGWYGQMVMPAVVGSVAPGSVAERAGIIPGDTVKRVNHEPVFAWQKFEEVLKNSVGQEFQMDVERDGRTLSLQLSLPLAEKDALLFSVADELLGVSLGAQVHIDSVVVGSAAERAGLMAGDQLLQVAGVDIVSVRALVRAIQQHAGKPLLLGVQRDGTSLQLQVIPEADTNHGVGRLGVHLVSKALSEPMFYQRGFLEGVHYGFVRTAEMTELTVQVMGKMLTAAISPDNLGGPIAIAQLAGRTADLGLVSFITFLALISVNLGVLNLLPIPVLDGGQLVYLALEKLRGKPLSEKMLEVFQLVGISLIGMLMVFAFYNDLMRLFRG
ncbi:MAG: RIP metalloprotease RseP [Mariprofundaceae bacterium]